MITLNKSVRRIAAIKSVRALLLFSLLAAPAFVVAQDEAKTDPQPEVTTKWTQSTFYKGFNFPRSLAVDLNGNVYVADWGNNRVVKVAANGKSSTVTASLNKPISLAIDVHGDVAVAYVDTTEEQYFVTLIVNTNPTRYESKYFPLYAHLDLITGLTFCGSGSDPNLYAAELWTPAIQYTDLEETVYSNAIAFGFTPGGIACDASGNLYVVDSTFSKLWKATPAGTFSSIGSGYNKPSAVAVDATGNVFVADYGNNRVVEITPAGVQTVLGTGLSGPTAVAVDNGKSEVVYVADAGNNRIVAFAQ